MNIDNLDKEELKMLCKQFIIIITKMYINKLISEKQFDSIIKLKK
jgi:hypothetical protein